MVDISAVAAMQGQFFHFSSAPVHVSTCQWSAVGGPCAQDGDTLQVSQTCTAGRAGNSARGSGRRFLGGNPI